VRASIAFALACLAGVAIADDAHPEHRAKRTKTRGEHHHAKAEPREAPTGDDRDVSHSDDRVPDLEARDHAVARLDADRPAAVTPPSAPKLDSPDEVAEQLAAQSQTIDRSLATVTDKLAAIEAARLARIRAAYRVLCTAAFASADPDERMAAARRLAAARLLLARDVDEHRLLADEASRLHAAGERVVAATAKVPTLTFPADLAWPARGSVARHFGLFGHDRSKTTLSRRGIDLDVDDHQLARAPADGTVRYAGPIRGLGQGVIIDHGDFLTVIAKLGELSIPPGTEVHRGDRIGRAARHRVYLEVRVRVGPGGLAIDPEPLLEKRTK
jgi:murein DD-endopeptidase MepM/ murein hydrolase activator NlpD